MYVVVVSSVSTGRVQRRPFFDYRSAARWARRWPPSRRSTRWGKGRSGYHVELYLDGEGRGVETASRVYSAGYYDGMGAEACG
jgi:hypothetical protein